eukprot:1088855-Amorphochlora_amoeboformis.AAC.2
MIRSESSHYIYLDLDPANTSNKLRSRTTIQLWRQQAEPNRGGGRFWAGPIQGATLSARRDPRILTYSSSSSSVSGNNVSTCTH